MPDDDHIEVVWETPPARKPNSTYGPALAEVNTRPDEWARIASFASPGSAYSARKSLLKEYDDPHWEMTVSKLNEEVGLSVRYRTHVKAKATTTLLTTLAMAVIWDEWFCCDWHFAGMDVDLVGVWVVLIAAVFGVRWSLEFLSRQRALPHAPAL